LALVLCALLQSTPTFAKLAYYECGIFQLPLSLPLLLLLLLCIYSSGAFITMV
jgi:hypothetical protein